MLELWGQSQLLKRILPSRQLVPGQEYRVSQFAFPFEAEGRHCLFHTLTRQCYDLEGLQLPAGVVSGESLKRDERLNQLAQDGFFVPVDRDEDETYTGLIRTLRHLKHREGRAGYTLLTTMACNARCVYCFEKGMKPVTMSPETTERVLDYISETHCSDIPVRLNWFGGEPLLNTRSIDRICEGLAERGIRFKSSITTNGSLIDDTVLEKMTGTWRMDGVQISMDGDEQAYISRKNYYRYQDEYHRVLDTAARIGRRGIRMNLRVNVDCENFDGVCRLIEDLDAAMERRSEVPFLFSPALCGMDERRYHGLVGQNWRISDGTRPTGVCPSL